MTEWAVSSDVVMDTIVTIRVPSGAADGAARASRALQWFREVEACCSRFDPASELRQLIGHVGDAVPVSPLLFEAVQFALRVAEASGGAFDPVIGRAMELRGFNREHRTGNRIETTHAVAAEATYRDVLLDGERRTITLKRPLVLDLGALAKGLAIDLAVRELKPLVNFGIDAGGDVYLGGRRSASDPWTVGIRDPRPSGRDEGTEIVEILEVGDLAVCTSGDYERTSDRDPDTHHILDPRSGESARQLASVTTIAESAMVADAVGTAAFVLGPTDGRRLCEQLSVEALMLSPAGDRFATRGMASGQYSRNRSISLDSQGTADARPDAADRSGGLARRS